MSNKIALHNACLQMVNEQLNVLKADLESLKESRNNQTKSSVGDKHETARAMMQLEEEKLSQQLLANQQLLQKLNSVPTELGNSNIAFGNLVVTDNGSFYLSAGIGKIVVDGKSCYAISMGAPMAQAMLGLKVHNAFTFNGREFTIESVA